MEQLIACWVLTRYAYANSACQHARIHGILNCTRFGVHCARPAGQSLPFMGAYASGKPWLVASAKGMAGLAHEVYMGDGTICVSKHSLPQNMRCECWYFSLAGNAC